EQAEGTRTACYAKNKNDSQRALLLQHTSDREKEQQVRNRGEHAVEPVEEIIQPSAVVACDRTEDGAQERGDKGRRQSHEDRCLRALDGLLEHVAAPFVGAAWQRGCARFGDGGVGAL